MKDLIGHVQIVVNEKIYLKAPESSELGRNIIKEGLILIDEVGLENFTFRKLAKRLDTTESSVYRYFENKHKLLIYLTSWYWGWMEWQMVFATNNIPSPEERLKCAIKTISSDVMHTMLQDSIDLEILNRIVISESSKAYLTKEVDESNKEGFYAGYKRLVSRLSDIMLEINQDFEYPHSLASTIVEGIHHQKYFADHLPSLTDINKDSNKLVDFYTTMALKTLKTANL